MRIGSLCSGAGGLDMAVEQVFGATTAWHCELPTLTDKQGRTRRNTAVDVLAHRWPGVPNHGDLTTTDWSAVEPVDIMCAGWPCQPWSTAGKKLGAADARAIWPDIAAAIRMVRPRIVVLENVTDVLARGEFTRVANSLAPLGYDLRWTCLPASAVGAPHRRERLFIVAYTDSSGLQRTQPATRRELPDGRPATDAAGDGLARLHGGPGSPPARPGWERQPSGGAGSTPDPVALLPTPAASRSGRNQSPSPGAAVRPSLDMITDLLPTPAASDSHRGPDLARANRAGSGGDDLHTFVYKTGRAQQWGRYAPAIHRWESITRPAPEPTERNTKGNPRLNPAFPEWMQGWPKGWVTAVPGVSRNDQLRLIGNGVVPQQAVAALTWLLSVDQQRQEASA